jgi:hypothetical protein
MEKEMPSTGETLIKSYRTALTEAKKSKMIVKPDPSFQAMQKLLLVL